MPQPRYRFRLPDGQVHEAALSFIKKTYPEATIVGRVVFDEAGSGVVVPFSGKQPGEDGDETPPSDEDPEKTAQDAIPATESDEGVKKAESPVKAKRVR